MREMGHVCVLDVCVCKCESVCRCVGVSVSVWGCVYWMGWLGYTVVCVCVYVYLCVLEHFCVHVFCVCVCFCWRVWRGDSGCENECVQRGMSVWLLESRCERVWMCL